MRLRVRFQRSRSPSRSRLRGVGLGVPVVGDKPFKLSLGISGEVPSQSVAHVSERQEGRVLRAPQLRRDPAGMIRGHPVDQNRHLPHEAFVGGERRAADQQLARQRLQAQGLGLGGDLLPPRPRLLDADGDRVRILRILAP
ncbi:MAG: hypothetical protein ACK4V1_08420, partial [Burkholderiaceae bacterium]